MHSVRDDLSTHRQPIWVLWQAWYSLLAVVVWSGAVKVLLILVLAEHTHRFEICARPSLFAFSANR
jgi:hypothetical protein